MSQIKGHTRASLAMEPKVGRSNVPGLVGTIHPLAILIFCRAHVPLYSGFLNLIERAIKNWVAGHSEPDDRINIRFKILQGLKKPRKLSNSNTTVSIPTSLDECYI
jgi:hypothetical protein